MSSQPSEPVETTKAFLQELIGRYGVEGLQLRLAAAIAEAADGRVAGAGFDEATEWLDAEFPEGGALAAAAAVAGAAAGLTHDVTAADGATVTEAAVVAVAAHADMTAQAYIQASGAVGLSNADVMVMAGDSFRLVLEAWGLLQVPIEAVPFLLLLAIAIALVHLQRKRQG